jgi:hypothetical protein
MAKRTKTINGTDEIQKHAAADAKAVQNACNVVAIVVCLNRHLLALYRSGISGDELINHPVVIAFTSKLNSLCRMTTIREMAAFDAIDRIERGEAVEYEVISL